MLPLFVGNRWSLAICQVTNVKDGPLFFEHIALPHLPNQSKSSLSMWLQSCSSCIHSDYFWLPYGILDDTARYCMVWAGARHFTDSLCIPLHHSAPWRASKLVRPVPEQRFRTSEAIRGSISHAITRLQPRSQVNLAVLATLPTPQICKRAWLIWSHLALLHTSLTWLLMTSHDFSM